MPLSPKVYLPALVQIIAGVALALIFQDQSFLLITLTGLATGGIGGAAPPTQTSGVTQEQLEKVAPNIPKLLGPRP